jgi:hypothetical protein
VRQADELDVSLRERVQRQGLGQTPALPRPPEEFRSELVFSDGELQIDIPLHWTAVEVSVPGCLILLFTYTFAGQFGWGNQSLPAVLTLVAAMLFISVLPWIITRFGFKARMRVTATPSELRVTQKGLFAKSDVDRLATEHLEELLLVEPDMPRGMLQLAPILRGIVRYQLRWSSKIVARSDYTTITFGQGLGSQELRYLHAILFRLLSGTPLDELSRWHSDHSRQSTDRSKSKKSFAQRVRSRRRALRRRLRR